MFGKCDREEHCYLKTRFEIEVCFGRRNGDRAGLVLAPAARLAAPAARDVAERSKHLTADILKNQQKGVLAFWGFDFLSTFLFLFC